VIVIHQTYTLEGGTMAFRNKTYVCFDGDEDMKYYRLMQAWKANDNVEFNFHDAHDLKQCRDSSNEETIKRSLRERMNNSKLLIVLVGEKTKNLFKFVRWEIETAMSLGIPIIVVNLNGSRVFDADRCPPILKSELAIHVPFNMKIIQYAIDHWRDSHMEIFMENNTCPHNYKESIYKTLGV